MALTIIQWLTVAGAILGIGAGGYALYETVVRRRFGGFSGAVRWYVILAATAIALSATVLYVTATGGSPDPILAAVIAITLSTLATLNRRVRAETDDRP